MASGEIPAAFFIVVALLLGCVTVPYPAPSEVVGEVQIAQYAETTVIPVYDRLEWHPRWLDADKDCQDTRQEVLISESATPPVMDAKGCRVLSGTWLDPYTGNTFTDPAKLDIDHVVPLHEAHLSGGWAWTVEQKRAYANDLINPESLQAVHNGANRSKGNRNPGDWMPPNVGYHCDYLKAWLQIKERYGLTLTVKEARAISVKRCE